MDYQPNPKSRAEEYSKTESEPEGISWAIQADKKIGKGNFAAVYLAQKLEDKANYAVKAFSK